MLRRLVHTEAAKRVAGFGRYLHEASKKIKDLPTSNRIKRKYRTSEEARWLYALRCCFSTGAVTQPQNFPFSSAALLRGVSLAKTDRDGVPSGGTLD